MNNKKPFSVCGFRVLFRYAILFLILANLTATAVLLVLVKKTAGYSPSSFYESIGVLSLAREKRYGSGVPHDFLLLDISKKNFPNWNINEQRAFLVYNTLTDDGSSTCKTILLQLAEENGLLSAWQYDLELLHDNSTDDSTRKKCSRYIDLIKKQLRLRENIRKQD